MINGLPIIKSDYALKTIEDWSDCRSIPRAKRHHAKGIKTRMIERQVPAIIMLNGRAYAHPKVIDGLYKNTKSINP